MKKKHLSAVFALSMAFVMTASSSVFATAPAPKTSVATTSSNFNEKGYPIVNKKITLSAMYSIDDRFDIDPKKNWALTRMEELTNIKVDYDMVKSGDFIMISNLMFASGKYPDMIMGGRSATSFNVEEYGPVQGILIPLDALMKRYMPNLTEILQDDHKERLRQGDGKIYSIPTMQESGPAVDPKLYINQRWLDELKLPHPTTVTELTDTLKAFKKNYPTGYPVTATLTSGTTNITGACFSFWGVTAHNDFMLDDKGVVQHVTQMPGYRKAIEWIQTMYAYNLIDPEFLTQSANVLNAKLEENNVGLTVRYSEVSGIANKEFHKDMVPLVPISADGYQQQIRRRTVQMYKHSFITKTNKYVPETMRWFDAWFQSNEFMYESMVGPENVTWKKVDGKMELNADQASDSVEYGLQSQNAIYYFSSATNNAIFAGDANSRAAYLAGVAYEEAGVVESKPAWGIINNFVTKTAAENDRFTLLRTDINTVINEHLASFVITGVTDRTWQAFQDNLKKAGLEEYTKICRGIYARYK